MKRLYCLLIILCIFLCACAEPALHRDDPTAPPRAEDPAATGAPEDTAAPQEEEPFCFYTVGKAVPLGIGEEEVIAILGEAQQVFDIPSCAFEGIDHMLYYSGFNIACSPLGEGYFLWFIALTDDSAETAEGAYVGLSRAQILEIYGEPAENEEMQITYRRAGTRLEFVFEGDTVVEITYYYDVALG
ncbi:MAG: hypothetical protein FWF10_06055 [Clostridiales bacterium]|nr:hypothetical protein [Clostridiales bacterium]